MKDGFYLSVYAMINPLGYLYSLSMRHDFNISLWKKDHDKIELIHVWELERMTGLKQHNIPFFSQEHAVDVLNKLLWQYRITLSDVVEVWGMPGLGDINTYYIRSEHPKFAFHSICHLFGSLMMNTEIFENEKILALAVDGGPDYVLDANYDSIYFYPGAYSDKGNVNYFAIESPGQYWAAASNITKLREGTLMALAYACEDRILDSPSLGIPAKDQNTREAVDQNISAFFSKLFDSIETTDKIQKIGILSEYEKILSRAMKYIQEASIEVMEKNVETAIEKFHFDPHDVILAIGGGYGLNCPTNQHLMKKYGFKRILAPPYMNDCGISIGLALYTFYKRMGAFSFKFTSPYLGNWDNSIDMIRQKYKKFIKQVTKLDYNTAAEDLSDNVVAWFDGRAEIGPRALGHRSLLGDPRSEHVKAKLNEIKQRQWWRPVAPIVLEEKAKEWFVDISESPYMLRNFYVKEEKKDLIIAVLHLDGSARVQTLKLTDNPDLYRVISCFDEKFGIPMICNTSLNDKGEPIIDKIEEMINFVLRKQIRIGYINGYRFEFQNHDQYQSKNCHSREIDYQGYLSDDEKSQWKRKLNPYDISREKLHFYMSRKLQFDITTKQGKRMLDLLYQNVNASTDKTNK